MNQSKLIENILKAAKTISSAQGNASILKNIQVRSERKRKLKKILWS